MVSHQTAQIMALIRSGKTIHIGGRPVIVPDPQERAKAPGRSHAIKLALAFVAIYVIWGSTYLAIRYAVETIPPLVTAGIRHSIAGSIMLAWAWWRGFRPTRQQWLAGFALMLTGVEKLTCCQPLAVSPVKVALASSVPFDVHRSPICVPVFCGPL